MTDSSHRTLCIVVPIYKNADLVRACVDSLLENLAEISEYRPRLMLINDSPDDPEVVSLLEHYLADGDGIDVMQSPQNQGFVRAVNLGLAVARRLGYDALVVNSDTQTFPGTLKNLVQAAKADPQIGFACPRSNNASICSLPHFYGGMPPTPRESFERWRQISRTMPMYHFAPTAVGFYLFISHAVLANHGGLREEFGAGYEEENDLVMRAGKLGSRAIIVNHAFAYHAGSASFKLTDIDLDAHRHQNLQKVSELHPEYIPLIARYETSAHFRAERLMTGLLDEPHGRIKVVFDLSNMGMHYNGTSELAVGVLRAMASRHRHRIRLTAVASRDAFKAHGLDTVQGLQREEPGASGVHGVAVRLAQPYDLHHVNTLESMAPVNLVAMLDTISEDCGPLSVESGFLDLWDHTAAHANGLIFISRFSEQTFCNRHPSARALPRWTRLLPTRVSNYARERTASLGSHILVVGNHFAHKGSDAAARAIAAAFPTVRVVVLGSETLQSSNITSFRSGQLEPAHIERLFADASIVVLPSHVEGFGFGFMHALAAGRPIVARRIPATLEILATLDDVEGVFLFEHDGHLMKAVADALKSTSSSANDARTETWADWADGLADFCVSIANRPDVFEKLVSRISAADRLRRALLTGTASRARAVDLKTLLAMDGREFVEHAYATVLGRTADETGLREFCAHLNGGAHKVELLQALANSAEGRMRDIRLPGLEEAAKELRDAAQGPPTSPGGAEAVDLESLLKMDGREFVEHAYATLLGRPADETGLRENCGYLECGTHKVDILQALANSPEGRSRAVRLAGLEEAAKELRGVRLSGAAAERETPVIRSAAEPVDLESLLQMDGREFVEHAYATLLGRAADEIGLKEYCGHLARGAHKVDLLQALSRSPEGRARKVRLAGLDEAAAELRRPRRPFYKRIIGRAERV